MTKRLTKTDAHEVAGVARVLRAVALVMKAHNVSDRLVDAVTGAAATLDRVLKEGTTETGGPS